MFKQIAYTDPSRFHKSVTEPKDIVGNDRRNLPITAYARNCNLDRNERLKRSSVQQRHPLSHKGVKVQEDLPRKGWKVDFESGLNDSAISSTMPSYFTSNPHFDIIQEPPQKASGVKSHFEYHLPKSGLSVNIDDAAVSGDAPDWFKSEHTSVTKRQEHVADAFKEERQKEALHRHLHGHRERNVVNHLYPISEPYSSKITQGGWKTDFESGANDSAISGDMPQYFQTNEHFEVLPAPAAKATGVRPTATFIDPKSGTTIEMDDSSISKDAPQWMLKQAAEVRQIPYEKRKTRKRIDPQLQPSASAHHVIYGRDHSADVQDHAQAKTHRSPKSALSTAGIASLSPSSSSPQFRLRINNLEKARVQCGPSGIAVSFDQAPFDAKRKAGPSHDQHRGALSPDPRERYHSGPPQMHTLKKYGSSPRAMSDSFDHDTLGKLHETHDC